jgi:hypothetical protein
MSERGSQTYEICTMPGNVRVTLANRVSTALYHLALVPVRRSNLHFLREYRTSYRLSSRSLTTENRQRQFSNALPAALT